MDSLATALQPILQPITHNLPQPLADFGTSLLGTQCYTSLVLDIDLTNTECLKLAVSKGLGIGIVTAASIVKVPQILNLVRSKSASGVSLVAYLLETTSYLISLVYNIRNGFPFSTYGETAFILAQNVVITVLVLTYGGKQGAAALLVAVLAAGVATLFSEAVVDMGTLGYLQAGAGTLGVVSKVPQIVAIFQEGGTGQLSAFTVSDSSFCCSIWHFAVCTMLSPHVALPPTFIPLLQPCSLAQGAILHMSLSHHGLEFVGPYARVHSTSRPTCFFGKHVPEPHHLCSFPF